MTVVVSELSFLQESKENGVSQLELKPVTTKRLCRFWMSTTSSSSNTLFYICLVYCTVQHWNWSFLGLIVIYSHDGIWTPCHNFFNNISADVIEWYWTTNKNRGNCQNHWSDNQTDTCCIWYNWKRFVILHYEKNITKESVYLFLHVHLGTGRYRWEITKM